jgi:hypothetical protein
LYERPHREFWRRHPGLVWSNPEATDSAHIRAALLRPRFGTLLEIATEFGVVRLKEEWAVLQAESTGEAIRAQDGVQRILSNIEEGFERAAA